MNLFPLDLFEHIYELVKKETESSTYTLNPSLTRLSKIKGEEFNFSYDELAAKDNVIFGVGDYETSCEFFLGRNNNMNKQKLMINNSGSHYCLFFYDIKHGLKISNSHGMETLEKAIQLSENFLVGEQQYKNYYVADLAKPVIDLIERFS